MSLEDLAFPPTVQEDVFALTGHARAHVSAAQEGGDQNRGKSSAGGMDAGSKVVTKLPFPPTSDPAKINIERDTKTHAQCILALDLGTKTGYALRRRDGVIVHGTERFMQRNSWHPGQRFINFRAWLGGILTQEQVHVIAYENVVFGHSSSQASNVYGAFWGAMLAIAATRNIECVGFAVPTVKKAWTGSGRAKKPDMIAEAKRRGFRVDDDNNADALAILFLAVTKEGE